MIRKRAQQFGLVRVVGGVLAVGVAGALGLVFAADGDRSPRLAEAQAFLDQIPDEIQVDPGQVMYTKMSIYERRGPKEKEIADATGIPTESMVAEAWEEVGPGETITRSFGQVFDDDGQLVRQSIHKPGASRTTNILTGDVVREDEYRPLPFNAPQVRADRFEVAISRGEAEVVEQTGHELVIEIREAIPSHINGAPRGEGWQLPYYADLDPTSIVTRTTIRDDGVLLAYDTYVVVPDGSEVLVSSQRLLNFEILDSLDESFWEGR